MATENKPAAPLTDLEYAIQLILTGKKDPEFAARVQAETEKITPQIAHEIRNQYVIGYTPESTASGGFRNIRVEVNVPNATVRTRSGYYANGK